MSPIFLCWWISRCWVGLCSSSHVLAQTLPLLFYSGNVIIFSLIITFFILFVFFMTSKLIFILFPRQFLALASAFTRLQWMQWALVFALTLEGLAWDGTFEETHIHPEYGVPTWGASFWGWFRALSCWTVTGSLLWVPQCWRQVVKTQQDYTMNKLDFQLTLLSAEGYCRCHQKFITAAFFFTLSLPLCLSLAPHLTLYFFLHNGNKTLYFPLKQLTAIY